MSRPFHKSGTSKFDIAKDARTIAPLTSEDLGQFVNISLMSSLRSQNPSVTGKKNSNAMIDNPPSFYDDDIKKKLDKYNPSIKDR